MTTLQSTMTSHKAALLLEEAITQDLMSEVECGWKDHWYQITEDPSDELKTAIETLTGKDIDDVNCNDINFGVRISVTINN